MLHKMFIVSIQEADKSDSMDPTCHSDACIDPLASNHCIIILKPKYYIYYIIWVSPLHSLCPYPAGQVLSLFHKQTINQLMVIRQVHR